MNILYEDNHLIAVNKKPSELVQGDKTGDLSLDIELKGFLKKKYNKPGNVFVGVVHRIDRPVSGAVLFAKTGKALSRLNALVKNRDIEKLYWAVVKNLPPEPEGKLVNYLIKNPEKNKVAVFNDPKEKSLKAELNYRCLGSSDNYHLLEIQLITGRPHQIRAQLAHIGCPVKGDVKYGFNRTNRDASIHLHAREINFLHPVKKTPLKIRARPPADPIWDYFFRKFS